MSNGWKSAKKNGRSRRGSSKRKVRRGNGSAGSAMVRRAAKRVSKKGKTAKSKSKRKKR